MREIVLDTETTGLDPSEGHRIVEIACIELMHHVPTGRKFHRYVNPERDMPEDALAVHGITAEFLAGQPSFAAIADELLAFVGSDPLVIHNAEFDLAFLNAELARLAARADQLPVCRYAGDGARAVSRRAGESRRACAAASTSTCRCASSTAPRSIAGCSPRSIWSCSAAGSPVSILCAPHDAGVAVERILRAPRPHAPSAEELIAHQAMLQTAHRARSG